MKPSLRLSTKTAQLNSSVLVWRVPGARMGDVSRATPHYLDPAEARTEGKPQKRWCQMAKKFRIKFHKNANRKLVRYAREIRRELGTWQIIREIARRLEVNHRYVSDNLIKGIEPPDTTPEGRATRIKLFMKEHKPKPRQQRQKLIGPITRTDWVKEKIKVMAKETVDSVVKRKPSPRGYDAVVKLKRSSRAQRLWNSNKDN